MPQRLTLSVMGLLAIINAYSMRLGMDMMLTNLMPRRPLHCHESSESMDHFAELKGQFYNETQCGLEEAISSRSETYESDDSHAVWSFHPEAIFLFLTSFYVVTQIPGGYWAEQYGGKWLVGMGLLLAAALTVMTPLAAHCGGPMALIVIRIMFGLCQGPLYPAVRTLLARWVPASERSTLGALILSGSQLSVVFSNLMMFFILKCFDWMHVFYFFGGCALTWFGFFVFLCFNDPSLNPRIGDTEKKYLMREVACVQPYEAARQPTPWRSILTSPAVWAHILATVQHDVQQARMIMKMLKMYQENSGQLTVSASFNVVRSSSMPHLMNWLFSLASGLISDYMINHRILSITTIRKIVAVVSAVGPNLCVALVSCASDCFGGVVRCTIGIIGTYYASDKLAPLDLSPNYAGTLTGLANSIGSLSAAIVVYLDNNTNAPIQDYYDDLRSVILLFGCFLISGKVQYFNDPPQKSHTN